MINNKTSIKELTLIGKELERKYNLLINNFKDESIEYIDKDNGKFSGNLDKATRYYNDIESILSVIDKVHRLIEDHKGSLRIDGVCYSFAEKSIEYLKVHKNNIIEIIQEDNIKPWNRYRQYKCNEVIFDKKILFDDLDDISKKINKFEIIKSKIEVLEEIEVADEDIIKLLSK